MAKTVIVTGASKGIGLAVARYLVKEGHNVIVAARTAEPLEELRAQTPAQVRAVAGDLTDPSTARRATKLAEEDFGGLDGLIINHGAIAPVERLCNAGVQGWKEAFDVNFFSAVTFLEVALPALRRAPTGRVIFTSSGAAIRSYSGWGAYCAAKAALKSLAETLAIEEKGITSVSVRPGVVDTDMQQDLREKHLSVLDEGDQKRFGSLKKDGKLLRPDQPGNVIARLSLEASQDLSGRIFSWDDNELASFQDASGA